MRKRKGFEPDWRKTPPAKGSWRSIFKWGDPHGFKHPGRSLYALLKDSLDLADVDFRVRRDEGDGEVSLKGARPVCLTRTQVGRLEEIAGRENVESGDYARVRYATGKTMEEAMELRLGMVRKVPDLVVHPRSREVIQALVAYCNQEKIPVYAYGGGSSVTLGLRPARGGVTLVMGTHMNRMIGFNEENCTATVESGIMGPAYEKRLNQAPERFGARFAYTCGHFPQSFEHSSVGGWVLTRGSGQNSSYYGDACDLVIGLEVVTPSGTFKTLDFPATATGPMIRDMIKGSEGAYGILVSVTMKIFRHMPKNRKRFGFMFPSWEKAVRASREISQGQFGMPSVFRISDPEETLVGLKQHGIEGSLLDRLMTRRGYRPMARCLCIGHTEGEEGFSKNVYRRIRQICKKHGAISMTGYPVLRWEQGRFRDPYLREELHDYGVLIDTLETGVRWDNLQAVYQGVRALIKQRPRTLCLTHCSHFYPQGTNLYFIFIGRFETLGEYLGFQRGIIAKIAACGGSLSHHHGVGKMIAPWMEGHLGKEQMDILRALKNHFDPNHIMNPGGTLGLE